MIDMIHKTIATALLTLMTTTLLAINVKVTVPKNATNRTTYAAEYLTQHLHELGYTTDTRHADYIINLVQGDGTGKKEGFSISAKGKRIVVAGNDGSGVIYGACEIIDRLKQSGATAFTQLNGVSQAPEMVLRGSCIGLQKTVYLPGHSVYEYPYTPENFPWFYDKELWIRYLDMLVSNRMNSLYLWNGHPFASLVKLKDYPFALEVDDATLAIVFVHGIEVLIQRE